MNTRVILSGFCAGLAVLLLCDTSATGATGSSAEAAGTAATERIGFIVRKAHRTYELGEPVMVRMIVTNPDGLAVVGVSSKASIRKVHAEGKEAPAAHHVSLVGLLRPPRALRLKGTKRRVIFLDPFNLAKNAKNERLFAEPGTYLYKMEVSVDILRGSRERRRVSIKTSAEVLVRITEPSTEYLPALGRDVLAHPRLHKLTSGLEALTKPEAQAVEIFGLNNARRPIGKYLLFWRALIKSEDVSPWLNLTNPEKAGKMTFPKVVLLGEKEREVLYRDVAAAKPQAQHRFAARYLERLLEGDDGTFALYGQAAVLLAKQYLALNRRQEAMAWLRKAAATGLRAAPETEEAMLLLAEEYIRSGQRQAAAELCRELGSRVPKGEPVSRRVEVLLLAAMLGLPLDQVVSSYSHRFDPAQYRKFCSTELDLEKLRPPFKGKMKLGQLIELIVGLMHGGGLPVAYQNPSDYNVKVRPVIPDAPVKTAEFFKNLLGKHGLEMRFAKGYLVISRKRDKERAKEAIKQLESRKAG
jgi:tetratricopeptide (TPR) repeat protein